MNRGKFSGWMLFVGVTVAAMQIMAQQNTVPILRPQKSIAKPKSATLLVDCDMACNWELDGTTMGLIAAGGMAKTKVDLGQHLLKARVAYGHANAMVAKDIDIKTSEQTVVHLELFQAYLADINSSARKWSNDYTEGLELTESKHYVEALLSGLI